MKKSIIYTLIAIAALPVLLVSCNKYLDVKPQDRFTEGQVFASEENITAALNGIYMALSSGSLYGNNLTMSVSEILAQRYNVPNSHTYYQFAQYGYGDNNVKAAFEGIWTDAYVNILNLNNFIACMPKQGNIISTNKANILLGEAYGLRAFLHFDMLRIFGPICSTKDSSNALIPYYAKADAQLYPLLQANVIMDSILADLHTAETLLTGDPIIAMGVGTKFTNEGDDFYNCFRNRRMNFYAVKALQARVYLYRGYKMEAYTAAKAVLDEGEKWFPWLPYARIVSDKKDPDRIFSPEVIFGIQNNRMYWNQEDLFGGSLFDSRILVPVAGRLATAFENNENDYRYITTWFPPATGGKSYKTFFKYDDIVTKDSMYRMFQPLLRKTELYYILAECAPDSLTAISYLDRVRYNRGLTNLSTVKTIAEEIGKEYVKEFFGEGQLFFYYKRKNIPLIPNGAATSGNVGMTAAKYVVPLPDVETQSR